MCDSSLFLRYNNMKNIFSEGMKAGDAARELRKAIEPEYGAREAAAITRLAFSVLKGWSATDLVVRSDWPLSAWMADKLSALLDGLKEGNPVQYLLGEARFYGMDLKVTPATLIPRLETEELVDIIVKENPETDLNVLDIGTGSGAIAIALSRNLRFPNVEAIDISPEALKVAAENAARLTAKVDFMEKDIFRWSPEESSLDIIVSNPPYIAESERADMERHVVEHEPESALFVPDSDPTLFYRRIALVAADALRPGGKLYFEINPLFARDVEKDMEDAGFEEIRLIKDSAGKLRFAAGVKS